jgi:hypothetical protein
MTLSLRDLLLMALLLGFALIASLVKWMWRKTND